MKKDNIKRIVLNIVYPLLAIGLIIAIWAIVGVIKNNPLVLPMPGVVIERFFELGSEAGFWSSVGASLLRTLICFITSFVLALLFASIAGIFKPLHKVLSPMVTILRAAPTVAVILIMYAFIGNDTMAIVVGFLIAFPIMYSAFYGAIVEVDKDLIEMANVYKVKPINKVLYIYLPSITPCLFDTSKSTISLSLKVVIAAEILTNVSMSIGGKVQVAYASFEIIYLLAWTIVAIVFSFVLEAILAILKKVWEVSR